MKSVFKTYDRGETRFIVPLEVGDKTINAIEALLVNSDTGGFTKNDCVGAWRQERHHCLAYDVAGLSFDTLRQCAELALAAGQTDVYVRLPDGTSGWFNHPPVRFKGGDHVPAPWEYSTRDIEAERKRQRLSDIYA